MSPSLELLGGDCLPTVHMGPLQQMGSAAPTDLLRQVSSGETQGESYLSSVFVQILKRRRHPLFGCPV